MGRKIAHGFAVLLVVAFVLAPIYVLLLVSLTQQSTEFSGTPQWLPSVTSSNFGSILSNWRGFFQSITASTSADLITPAIRNSLIVAVPVALVNMLVAAPAGYAVRQAAVSVPAFDRARTSRHTDDPVTRAGAADLYSFQSCWPD